MGLSSKKKRRIQAREIHIPTELVTEILTRLPAKTLMRFKCISKLWASLIRSQYFSNRFLMDSKQQRLYMCFWDDINSCKDDPKCVILSLVPDATNPSSFVIDHGVTIPWLGSYNLQNICGFMCSLDSKIPRIYNPSTRQLVTLPDTSPCSLGDSVSYCFGHDPVNDQYKVICSKSICTTFINRMAEPPLRSCIPVCSGIRRRLEPRRISCILSGNSRRIPGPTFRRVRRLKQWVLVLKPGASWKEVAPTSDHMPSSRPGLSINGRIYYLALSKGSNYVVVSFDIESEKFETIQAPCLEEGGFREGTLIDYGGKVAVFDDAHLTSQGIVELWILQDAGNKEWSKKTLVLQPSQLLLVHNIYFEVKGTSQSGKVLLIPLDLRSPFYILCYDLQNNDMTKIDINGMLDHWFDKNAVKRCFSLMYMDQSESILHFGDLN